MAARRREPATVARTALVTGGASGIGRAIVERLEREGTDVRVLDIRDGFDVADPAAWESVDAVDAAFLNAGVVSARSEITELPIDDYRRVVGVNLDGVVFGVRRLARVLERGSAIVVTASLAGLTTIFVDPIYGGTKHFVVGFVRSVAKQLGERGIRINAVCPAFVGTAMVDRLKPIVTEIVGVPFDDLAAMKQGRLGTPEEVAEMVAFLASDESSWCNGGAYVLDGGLQAAML